MAATTGTDRDCCGLCGPLHPVGAGRPDRSQQPDHPRRRTTAGTARRPRKAGGDDEGDDHQAGRREAGSRGDIHRQRAAGERERDARLDDGERPLRARPEARLDRLHRSQGRQGRRRARNGQDGCRRCPLDQSQGSRRLRRAPRRLRGRRRSAGSQGRLPARAHGDDSPEEGAARHADHRQGRGHGLADVRERRSGALRQQVHGRRLGQHDARDCGLQAPRCRRGGGALDRVRRIQSHRALPEHGAVPRAVDG